MAYRNNFYVPKRSEYRQNYLPFDYYDFWITAKENENLRFKNKLRDYLHTPFDWDEDQDYYFEKSYDINKFEQANQGTQTTERPNRHDHVKLNFKDEEEKKIEINEQERVDFYNKNKKYVKSMKPVKKNESNDLESKATRSAYVQVNGHPELNVSKPRRARSAKQQQQQKKQSNQEQTNNNKNQQQKNKIKFADKEPESNLLASKRFTSSLSSMAVQTPLAWQLRDYKISNNSRPVSRTSLRSSSVSNFQPKRPPFANYGWATRTKDLSLKPTHNALANKVLATHDDQDAILELTLHKLKKDANKVANEFSVIESQAADHFQNFRSDSRAWNSEYDEKYPDYSKTALKKDIYHQSNPNRLTKSSLISSYAPLRRGPRSAKKKIYYKE